MMLMCADKKRVGGREEESERNESHCFERTVFERAQAPVNQWPVSVCGTVRGLGGGGEGH